MQMSDIEWFDNYRPTRTQMLPIWWRRLYFKGKTSWPYISGDAFASISDVHVHSLPLSSTQRVRLKSAKIIFVDSAHFLDFLGFYEDEIPYGSSLILGNGDFDVTVIPEIFLRKNLKLFAQNLLIPSSENHFSIPAGLENIDYGRNGMPKYFKPNSVEVILNDTILFGPFGDTHPSRRKFLAIALAVPEVFYIPPKRVEPRDFSILASKFKFVFCPRGNGFDSHRFWETLYRGRYPIVENSIWARNLRSLGIPMIIVENFSDLNSDFLSALHVMYPTTIDPRSYKALWMPYWDALIVNESQEENSSV